jgi:peptidoglycan/LPS O-acetylase OafA/YrhL
VITFFCGGFYILQDAFANPISEGAAALICAALMIAFAAVLLFFLIRPTKRPRTTNSARSAGVATLAKRPALHQASRPSRQELSRNNLPYQRVYVDHSFIRP